MASYVGNNYAEVKRGTVSFSWTPREGEIRLKLKRGSVGSAENKNFHKR